MAGNAEYVIDIAAELTGDETMAELDELTSELMGAGRGAEFFQQAIQRVSRDLEAASAAAASANADLAAGQSEYRALEVAANQAAKTVERLGLKGDAMSRQYLEAAKASANASEALGTHATKLAGLESAAASAAAREEKLADTMRGVTKISSHVDKSIAGQAEAYEKLGSGLGAIGGPVGSLGQTVIRPIQGFSKLSASIGEANAAAVVGVVGFGALAAAAVALTAALAVGALKVAEYAVSLADTRRNAELAVEALQVMQPELLGMTNTIADVSEETGMHADELNKLGGALLKAGKSADQMEDSLRAAAYAEVALGKGASSGYLTLVQAATDAQKAVDEAAAKSGGAVDKKLTAKLDEANKALGDFEQKAVVGLGGVVARQMQGLGAQSQRLESNLGDLFGGLDIDPVLKGMSKLVDLFDENSASGKAIKFIFESIFQPLIDGADEAATAVEAFVLGFLIGAMKLYLALRPAIKAVEEFFGLDGSELEIDFKTITQVGEALAPVLLAVAAVVGGVLLVAFLAIGAAIAAQVAVWYGVYKVVGLVIDIFGAFVSGIEAVASAIYDAFVGVITPIIDYFQGEIDLTEAATRIVMGIVDGFLGVAGAVLDAWIGIWQPIIDFVFGFASTVWNAVDSIFPGVTGAISGAAGSVVGAFQSLWAGVMNFFSSISLASVGTNIMMGLVSGVTGSIGAVVNAVAGAMRSAISAAKSVLGIHSPSSVFRDDIMGNVVEGAVVGAEDGASDVASAYETMLAVPPANDVLPDPAEQLKQAQLAGDTATIERLQGATSPADRGAPAAPDAGDGGGSGGAPILGDHNTFNFYGLPDAKGVLGAFDELLDAAIEGDAAKLGAARGKAA